MNIFLICHHGALGDFILTWPALRCLRQVLAGYHFLGVGRLEYMRFAVELGLLDECLSSDAANMTAVFAGHSLPPTCGAPQGAVLWLSQAAAMQRRLATTATLPVVAIPPLPRIATHLAQYYCDMLRAHFPITIPADLAAGFPVLPWVSGDYAIIHPGSGGQTKNYRPAFYRQVADDLCAAGYRRVGVMLGPVEQERGLDREFAGHWLITPPTIGELADVLRQTALFIGNDSGASHLAGISGAPTIALYKTTDPAIWGVVGPRVVHLRAPDDATALSLLRQQLLLTAPGKNTTGEFKLSP